MNTEPTRTDGAVARRWGRIAALTAFITFLLIVLGGWVRITGSGMGCGPDWPRCNGQWIPFMDLETFIEWSHRLVAAVVGVMVAGLTAHAWWPGRGDGWRWRRTLSAAALALLVVQVLLGAVTVRMELPPTSVILHLGTAMLLLAVLLVAATRQLSGPRRPVSDGPTRTAWGLAAGGFVVVLLGALVANLDAAPACQGFPLCNGELVPPGSFRVHLHWGHRMAAYALALSVLVFPAWVARRRPGNPSARRAAWTVLLLAVGQVAVGGAMVLQTLPEGLRALHVALGAGLFGALVVTAELVRRRPTADGARSGG